MAKVDDAILTVMKRVFLVYVGGHNEQKGDWWIQKANLHTR